MNEPIMNGVSAVERIARECFRSFRQLPGAQLIDDGRLFGVLSGVPIPFFNGIATTDLAAEEVGPALEKLQSHGHPFRWWISPSTRPPDLAAILQNRGLQHIWDAEGMAIDLGAADLEQPWPPGVTIRRVVVLDDWARVFQEGFELPVENVRLWKSAYEQLPDWAHFVGYLDERPVAMTSVLLCGDLAGIYFVATLPDARGRGIGRAVTVEALRYAASTGTTHAALQSSEMGFSVYRAIGFVRTCSLSAYHWRPEVGAEC